VGRKKKNTPGPCRPPRETETRESARQISKLLELYRYNNKITNERENRGFIYASA